LRITAIRAVIAFFPESATAIDQESPSLIARAFHQGTLTPGRIGLGWIGYYQPEENAMPFRNRSEAGRRLAVALARYKEEEPAILALPRWSCGRSGGRCSARCDPRAQGRRAFPTGSSEGAVVDRGASIIVRNGDVIEQVGIDEDGFKAICDAEFAEIERRRERYFGNRERAEIAGRTAIVIDDGIATGATTRAALRATRMRHPKRLVLAVPVAPGDSLSELRREADDLVCLEDHPMFGAIGFYYRDFRQVSDEEVIEILQRFPAGKPRNSSLAGGVTRDGPK
jgi:putative phosphoribosyl transferase